MKLIKVNIDSFRSIQDAEFNIIASCIGLVGINESGKSNILKAISVLSEEHKLTIADTPKKNKINPKVRFHFQLDKTDFEQLHNSLSSLIKDDSELKSVFSDKTSITLTVLYNRTTQEEERFYQINDLTFPKEFYILKNDAFLKDYLIFNGLEFCPAENVIIIDKKNYNYNKSLLEKSETRNELRNKIEQLNISNSIENKTINATHVLSETAFVIEHNETDDITEQKNTTKTQKEIEQLSNKLSKLEEELSPFDVDTLLQKRNEELTQINALISLQEDELKGNTQKLNKADPNTLDEEEKTLLVAQKKIIAQILIKKEKNVILRNNLTKQIEALSESFTEKYSQLDEELSHKIIELNSNYLNNNLPRVVFWKYSDDYILKGTTEFIDMTSSLDTKSISRPLFNLFRITFNINTMTELKEIITEIQNDSSERRRHESSIEKAINKYIKSVWIDYNQKIKVSLEQERILVQFFDPSFEDASFFEMQERSQGCQTFISFLLTIGAEAKQGVIKNTVLLLDEPETHLHPSGVRFMLDELIKAGINENYVIYATHSIHMIDKKNYNRHYIINKDKEATVIQPSCKSRIGYFMQEEVLYSTLDIDLNHEFNTTNTYNFVFEGEGDVVLFNHYFSKLTNTELPCPSNATSFYQGGKCSSIKKCFEKKPIQLGSYWFFILDNDAPANNLKSFLENRYTDFINKYIYIFQYNKNNQDNIIYELEDLLPTALINESIEKTKNLLQNNKLNSLFITPLTEQNSFNNFFHDSLISLDNDLKNTFQGEFKTILNKELELITKTMSKKIDFQKNFPIYHEWIQDVSDKIKKGITKHV